MLHSTKFFKEVKRNLRERLRADALKTLVEAEIEKALQQGKRYDVIAKELRVSAKTIAKVAKKMNEVSPSQVFAMFESDVTPMQVVKDTNANPTIIRDWYRAWVDMHEDVNRYKALKEETPSEVDHEESKETPEVSWRDFLKPDTGEREVDHEESKETPESEPRDWRDVFKKRR